MKKYKTIITLSAVRDLQEIYNYIELNDGKKRAESVLSQIEQIVAQLKEFPERGVAVSELKAMSGSIFRERFYKPYRIIYKIEQGLVKVYFIVDGRRDFRTALEKRLLQ